MKKIEIVATLRLTFEPKMDTPTDIRERVEGEINYLLNHGHLEGCEHGAQLESWNLNIATTNIE